MSERLERGLREFVNKVAGVTENSATGKVLAVDKEACTCDVQDNRNDDLVYYNVRLRASIDNKKTGFVVFPKVDSQVIVEVVEGDKNTWKIALWSEIDEVILLEGENGGLVKVEALVSELDALKSELNTLKQIFSSWVPVANDGGAALKTAASSWANSQISQTNKSSLENEKIKH